MLLAQCIMHIKTPLTLLSLALPLALGCASDDSSFDSLDPEKADTAAVNSALEQLTADGELSADDVDELFDAAGNSVSRGEMLGIRDATESRAFDVTDAAVERALERAYDANRFDYELAQTADPSVGYGGVEIPEAVRALVSQARLNGAFAFDVREIKSDGQPRWTHYPATAPPVGNMAFDYTVVTPDVLAADAADTQVVYNAIVGTQTMMDCDAQGNCEPVMSCDQTGKCEEVKEVTYEERVGGTGNIVAQYDEAQHEDLEARGSASQKWANNCAFLSDGSIHCLPAARRSVLRDVILTNPSLSRCNQFPQFQEDCHTLMYMGHISASNGVITDVEVSGRVSKRVASGKANLIDPIALLDAWGFQRSSFLRVRYGNTSDGTPVTNQERGILEAR